MKVSHRAAQRNVLLGRYVHYTNRYITVLTDHWLTYFDTTDLAAICKMILNFEAEMADAMGGSFSLKDVILFKVDLSKAFHLLSFNPGSVPYLACELYQSEWPQFSEEIRELLARLGISDTEGSTLSWSMVYITGSFGLILVPFVVAVVTRCLLILLLTSFCR